jgi:hypothetical protein
MSTSFIDKIRTSILHHLIVATPMAKAAFNLNLFPSRPSAFSAPLRLFEKKNARINTPF